jgi:hypothetical protein
MHVRRIDTSPSSAICIPSFSSCVYKKCIARVQCFGVKSKQFKTAQPLHRTLNGCQILWFGSVVISSIKIVITALCTCG